jgi:hypothetical protein
MLAARSLVAPVARASARPQIARTAFHVQLSSLRTRVGALSTVSDVIIHDHKALKECYNEIVDSADHDHQSRYGNQFVWELARHSIAEELIIYPAFEKYLGQEGKGMAESDRKEHHKVDIVLVVRERTTLIAPAQRTSQRISEHEGHTSRVHPETQGIVRAAGTPHC